MDRKEHLFIAIEGIDGVGKTTCAKILAKRVSAYYYRTPSGLFERNRTKIDTLGDFHLRFIFYLASVFHATNRIRKLLTEQPVICDRYIYSTIAYHKALGVDLSYIDLERLPILLPDFSIYLWADERAYIHRLTRRGSRPSSDKELEINRVLQQRIHREFLSLPLLPIDTSNLNPNEVCDVILVMISQ
jgi:dTMP kinase